ncbi:MAG: glycoside hydrolase family 43 protein [Pedobacter sp.]|nr:glycoside hydrolase family 43 protein [Pedobacter sp.]
MKKFTIIIFILFTFFSANAQRKVYLFSYFNNNGQDGLHLAYSKDGYQWTALKNDKSFLTPMVSKDKLMRDPCIIKGADGLFHMVWTVSWKDKGIGYASSKNLINWSEQKFIPVMAKEAGARNTWAPEITYDSANKTYMIYWATTIIDRFPETDSKAEDGYNHRIYYVTTKDFKSFSETKLLYDPSFNVIDATIVKEKDRFIMFLKDETKEPDQKNLKIAYSDHLIGPYSKASEKITGNYWAEGPTTLKIGKDWLVYFDKYREHKYGAIQSSDLVNWTDVSAKIAVPKGIRHGTILTIKKRALKKLLAVK